MALKDLDREQLRVRYQQLHGQSAPQRVSAETMRTAVGLKLQRQLVAQLRRKMIRAIEAAETIVDLLSTTNCPATPGGVMSKTGDSDG